MFVQTVRVLRKPELSPKHLLTSLVHLKFDLRTIWNKINPRAARWDLPDSFLLQTMI